MSDPHGNASEAYVPENTFARPGCGQGCLLARMRAEMAGEFTFSMDPQQRRRLFPALEDAALNEPHPRVLVTSIASSVEIDEGVGRREPL